MGWGFEGLFGGVEEVGDLGRVGDVGLDCDGAWGSGGGERVDFGDEVVGEDLGGGGPVVDD